MLVLFLLHHIGISLESSKRHKLSRDYRVAVRCGAMLFNVSFGWQQECLRGILFFLRAIHAEEFLFLGCLVKGNLQGNDALWAEAIPLILMLLSLFWDAFRLEELIGTVTSTWLLRSRAVAFSLKAYAF